MTQTLKIALSRIRTDGNTQLRVETSQAVVQTYAEAMRRGAVFPQLQVVWDLDGPTYWLVDGYHRLAAYELVGVEEVECEFTIGTRESARLAACRVNAQHGFPRSNESKRNAVREALTNPAASGWSNAKIAEWCHVSAPFVAQIRDALDLTPSEVRGKNGKIYRRTEKLTPELVYACPSLAQAEAWMREHAKTNIHDLLRKWVEHLKGIENALSLQSLYQLVDYYSWLNATKKGPGLIQALLLRLEAFDGPARSPEWVIELDEAPSKAEAWRLATCAGLTPAERERAIHAWLQWSDWEASYKQEEAVTAALLRRWMEKHAPKPAKEQPPDPLTLLTISGMGKEELLKWSYDWRMRGALLDMAIARAREVAPELLVQCPDPLCCRLGFRSRNEGQERACPGCNYTPKARSIQMEEEAARTDFRRAATGSSLTAMLNVLNKSVWTEGDEDLFWARVAVWRDDGAPGLPRDDEDVDDVDEDDEDPDEDEDLDDEDEDAA